MSPQKPEAQTVVIAAGGTAGHVVPALAVADALRDKGAKVVFIGGQRAEAELVPSAGYRFEQVRASGISRRNPIKAARAVARAVFAVAQSRRLLRTIKPNVVIGGGGYIAGVVGLAAALERIPIVLTEADSHLGLANRLLARRAEKVCLSFPIAGRVGGKYEVTGRPVAPKFEDRSAARAEFGIGEDERCVLIFGGSLGARALNLAAPLAFADAPYRILHVCGTRDAALVSSPNPNYIVRDYVVPFGKALAAADVAVARSGGSVFELAQYGLPSVLIPYPHATQDHQTANARWMQEGGAAIVLSESELTPERLRREVDALLKGTVHFSSVEGTGCDSNAGSPKLEAMREAAQKLARPNAAEDIASRVLAVSAASQARS